MSDWFKMYSDGLDEPRMKYAIAKECAVCAVWVWTLSECCRRKSDTVRINDFVLFGASKTINVEVKVIETALKLLDEIEYIKLEGESLTVTSWEKRQSNYMRRVCVQGAKSVRTVSTQGSHSVLQEERRGDKREERRESKEDPIYDKFEKAKIHYPYETYRADVRKWPLHDVDWGKLSDYIIRAHENSTKGGVDDCAMFVHNLITKGKFVIDKKTAKSEKQKAISDLNIRFESGDIDEQECLRLKAEIKKKYDGAEKGVVK
jgi:hypothetical protein